MQRIAAEQRNLEEQQRREREAAAAAIRKNQSHEVNANASPDVKQTLKVCHSSLLTFSTIIMTFSHFIDLSYSETNRERKKSKLKLE